MEQTSENQMGKIKKMGVLLFAVLLFWEMLLPIEKITDTEHLGVFYAGFCLFTVLSATRWPAWMQIPIKLAIIYLLMNKIFYPILSIWTSDWWMNWLSDLMMELRELEIETFFTARYPVSRSLLFFFFLWLVSRSWSKWFISNRLIYLPFVLTTIYVALLDVFTEYDATFSVIRVLIYAIFFLSWIQRQQLLVRLPNMELSPKGWTSWTIILLVVCIGMGAIMPPFSPQWEIKPLLTTGWGEDGNGIGGSGVNKIGYSRDDTLLGGPLILDEEVVFKAEADDVYYWRGESKDIYTGKGWEQTNYATFELPPGTLKPGKQGSIQIVPSSNFINLFQQIKVVRNSANIRFTKPMYSHLFVPGQVVQVNQMDGKSPVGRISLLAQLGSFTSYLQSSNHKRLTRYSLIAQIPRISENELRKNTEEKELDTITRVYSVQLPESVPPRVYELAKRITSSATNRYDQVKAVEEYLKTSGQFDYQTDDVPTLPANKDFVDHFLFESKRGYCDHFSSSMVVLLRAADIPARWVKGFTPGDVDYDRQKQKYIITVRNKHAHSWVEVYFTGIGWIPFEPTPSFFNPTPITTEDTDHPADSSTSNSPAGSNQQQAGSLDQRLKMAEEKMSRLESQGTVEQSSPSIDWMDWIERFLYILLFLMVPILIYWLLRKWIHWWLLYRYSHSEDLSKLVRAYEKLLRWAEHHRGKRIPSQTIREFWTKDDSWSSSPSDETIVITRMYEEARYGGTNNNDFDGKRVWKIWRKLLKQLRP